VKRLILNADDLGASEGVNRGVFECHAGGVVTSASLMVRAPAAESAAAGARTHPGLSLGLHADLTSPWAAGVELADACAVEDELALQLERFERLAGAPPTHLDAHHHAHRRPALWPVFQRASERLGIPLRDAGPAAYVGDFYAHPDDGPPNLELVGVAAFGRLLEGVPEGWTEIGCHPGYPDDLPSRYLAEREAEVRTLTDPRARAAIDRLGIRLASFRDLPGRPGVQ
jgi:predicted glycoside hydrolase/deacetylase ChbG (UPF0249 family)